MPDSPNITINQPQNPDHDLLLTFKAEVATKLDRVISDVKDLKDNVAARVSDLEQEKASQRDVAAIQKAVGQLQRLVYIGLGVVLALQFSLMLYVTFIRP